MNPIRRNAPDNFREMAKGKSVNAVRILTGAHYKAVERWFREHGMEPVRGLSKHRAEATPEFIKAARIMTNVMLAERFQMSRQTVRRLRRENAIPFPSSSPNAKVEVSTTGGRRITFNRPGPQAAPDSGRDDSPKGLAADWLRSRGGGWKVNRCDADGTFNPRGMHYRVGTMLKTADEMMEMAARKGWKLVDIFSIAA